MLLPPSKKQILFSVTCCVIIQSNNPYEASLNATFHKVVPHRRCAREDRARGSHVKISENREKPGIQLERGLKFILMNSSSDVKASGFRHPNPSTDARGGHRGGGHFARGAHGGPRGGWHSRVAILGRPRGALKRGVSTGFRRPQGRGGRGGGPAVCFVCGAGEGRYKFKCCYRPFCSTSCYKTHVAAPCDGPAKHEQTQQQGGAPHPTVAEASAEPAVDELHAGAEDAVAEDRALTMAEPEAAGQIESGVHPTEQRQQGLLHKFDARGPPVESSSSSGEGESDDASSDESDASHGGKLPKWNATPRHHARGERKFDSLSVGEQERIKSLAATPEMQSASLRDAIRALVLAASRSPGSGASAFSSLMRRPDFAAFVASLMDVLVYDPENNQESFMQQDTCDQSAAQRCVGEPGSRLN
ncbi:hypothetical protein Esti_004656 [Eimeria stiedai]